MKNGRAMPFNALKLFCYGFYIIRKDPSDAQ